MSFAFPAVDPETSGQVESFPTPISKYLGASYDQGFHDSVLDSMMRMGEVTYQDHDDTPTLTAADAQKQYGVGDLKFDQPVKQSVAATLNQRKKDEMDRNFYLSQGASGSRYIPGMMASILGGVMNPVDLGLAFIPFVGEEAVASKVAAAGGGVLRQTLARGVVSREVLGSMSNHPQLLEHVINGVLGQTLYEVPNLIASQQDHADYTPKEALVNILGAGGLSAALHGAGKLLSRVGGNTRTAMMNDAINSFLKDEPLNPAKYVQLDENALWESSKFDEAQAHAEFYSQLDYSDVAKTVEEKFNEKVVAPAHMLDDGTILKGNPGDIHMTVPGIADVDPTREAIEGFITDKGRFVSRDDAAKLMGVGDFAMSEQLLKEHQGDAAFLTEQELSLYHAQLESGSDKTKAWNAAMELRANNRKSLFLQKPEVKQLIENEVKQRTQDFVDQQRKDYDPMKKFSELRNAEIQRQLGLGRQMPPKEQELHIHPENFDETEVSKIEDQISSLEKDLKMHSDQEMQQGQTKDMAGELNDLKKMESRTPEQETRMKELQDLDKRNKKQEEWKKNFMKQVEEANKPADKSIDSAIHCIGEKLI